MEPTLSEHRRDEPSPAARVEPAGTDQRHHHLPGHVAHPDAWHNRRTVLDVRSCPGERLLVLGRTPAGPCRTTRESPLRVRSRSGRLQPAAGDAGTRTASARSLHAGEVEPTEGLADPPQAPSITQQVLAMRSAPSSAESAPPVSPSRSGVTSCRRNAVTSRLAASGSGTTDRSSGSISASMDLQQAIDARLPAQLPERSADGFGDGSAVVLQVQDRHRARPTARIFSDGALVAFVAGVVLCGRVVGAARVVLKEQVDRLGGVHHRDGVRSLHRVRGPGGGVVGVRRVCQVRQVPHAPLRVGGHHVAPAAPASRPSGTGLPGPASRARPRRNRRVSSRQATGDRIMTSW